ncbi:hypothetical protein [Oleiagrimonas sp. C23AA]|uniref:hypothetical protein n=1 Tax=Oleiagrimonas sp. C23AA TaxID=2719047 RepID=UPI00142499EA|nr:hypothetical protein [Oleiagrimonas sp. C23AA]NII09304.1 hypothetical protein [Oleiagrimonas sp. C23AA]
MEHRWDFFKEHDSSFGLFYPIHYTMMAFEDFERAKEVEHMLIGEAGFPDEDVAAASGRFVVEEVESQDDANWLDHMQEKIARVVGTEAGYIEDDIKHARNGGAFVFVYTPDDERIERVHKAVERFHPVFARRYLTAGIERLTYPPQAAI